MPELARIDSIMFDENGVYIFPIRLQVLDDYQVILDFSNGQVKLFDCSYLLDKTIYSPLKDEQVFRAATVEDGILSWCDGALDIAPETLYLRSTKYLRPTKEQQRDIQELSNSFGKIA
jgi:hypothetical protein